MLFAVIFLESSTVLGLLLAIHRKNKKTECIFKTLASMIFLGFGLSACDLSSGFDILLSIALLAAFLGDLLLLSERRFSAGLVAFGFCHLAYLLAFSRLFSADRLCPVCGFILILIAAGILMWLRPTLGRLRWPVLCYIIVITLMVFWALSGVVIGLLPLRAALGAVLFFLSDIFVARHRFIHRNSINRFLGLPIYYAAQLLLASLMLTP